MIKRKDFKILSDIHDISLDETKIIELSPGTTIGPKVGNSRRYEIITLLGAGCIGCVYLVKDHESSGKLFVLKIIIPHHLNTKAKVDKFISLINDLYQLEHESYIEIIDLWKQKKLYFFVMEHIEGTTLSDWLHQQKNTGKYVSVVNACKMILQLCDVVQYFHKTRAHRLLHPNNVLIENEQSICLKVSDLGLEELLDDQAWERLCIHENYQNYLPPESASSSANGRLCDIYALGSILYEILTFQNFEDQSRLSSIRYDIPPGLDDIIAKATRIHPEERYRDIDALILALNTFQKNMEARKAKTLRYNESEVREKEKLNEASQILGAIVQKYKQKEKQKQKDESPVEEEQIASKFQEINAALKTKHEPFQIIETSNKQKSTPSNTDEKDKAQKNEDELLELSKQIQTTPEENHMEKLFAEETTARKSLSDIGPLEAIPVDPAEFPSAENADKEKKQSKDESEEQEPLLGKPKKLKLKKYFPGAKSTSTTIKKVTEEDVEKRHITKKQLITSLQEQKEQNIAQDLAHAQSILEKVKEEDSSNVSEDTVQTDETDSADEIATTNNNKLKKYALPSSGKKKKFKVTIDYKKDLQSLGSPKKVSFSNSSEMQSESGLRDEDNVEKVENSSSQEKMSTDSKTEQDSIYEQETHIDRKIEKSAGDESLQENESVCDDELETQNDSNSQEEPQEQAGSEEEPQEQAGSEEESEEQVESGSEEESEEQVESGSEEESEEQAESGSEEESEEQIESGSEEESEEQVESGSEEESEEQVESDSEEQVESGSEEKSEEQVESGSEEESEEQVESGSEEESEEQIESGSEEKSEEQVESGSEEESEEQVESGSEEESEEQVESGSEEESEEQAESDSEEESEEQAESDSEEESEEQAGSEEESEEQAESGSEEESEEQAESDSEEESEEQAESDSEEESKEQVESNSKEEEINSEPEEQSEITQHNETSREPSANTTTSKQQDDPEVENEIQQVLDEGDELAMDNLFEEAIYKWMQVAHLIDPVEIEERLMQVIDMAVEIAQEHLDGDEIWEAKKLLDQVIEHNQDDFVQSLYEEINAKLDNREQEFQEAIGQVNNHIQKKQYQAAIGILNTIRESFPEHGSVLDAQIVKVESAQRQIVADEEEYMQLMYTAKLLEDKENYQESLQTFEKIRQKQNSWQCPVTDISKDIERVSKMVASMQPSNKANQILTQIENLISQNKWKEANEAFENPIFNRKLLPKVEKRIAEKKKKIAELEQQHKKKVATTITLGVSCLVVAAILVYVFILNS